MNALRFSVLCSQFVTEMYVAFPEYSVMWVFKAVASSRAV